jgi:CheY-like chemotaxis protein
LIELPILFTVNVSPDIPDLLVGDEVRIRQMLLNLLSNAAKYSVKGFVKLRVWSEKVDAQTIILYFEVEDSGIGIKQENLNRLFGDFVQLGEAVGKKEVEGTGLGLAITRGFAEAMDGTITVQSEYGKGSIFRIVIPQILGETEKDTNGIKIEQPFAMIDPEHKDVSVLLYETRGVYTNSLKTTLDSLNVKYKSVSDQASFFDELDCNDKGYDFIFISSFIYSTVDKLIREKARENATTILITEFGELATETDSVKTLFMPAHSADISALFNNRFGNGDDRYKRRQGAGFIAPTARVLIVDDVNTNLIVAQGLLSIYKLQIDLCKSGQESIDTVQAKEYDIVFMDHMMPEMDGIEAVARIRALSGGDEHNYFSKLPIIALTANAVSGVKEMFLVNGFNDFLAKPIEVNLLGDMLEKWLPPRKLESDGGGTAIIADNDENELFIETLASRGIDVESGIYMTGGNVGNYLKTLTIFRDDGLEKIVLLREYALKEDWNNYAIQVHALKSASASIGSGRVSNLARSLESAAKKSDGDFVIKNSEKFIEELSMLLENIGVALKAARSAKQKTGGAKKFKIDIGAVTELADKLKAALMSFDMEEVDNVSLLMREQLQEGSDEEGVLNNIANSILICEYDKAEELTDELVNMISSNN